MRKLSDANILSMERITLAFDILTYKHDEKNPYPSHELLAEKFEVSKRAVTQAVSDIVKCGLFINEKGKYEGLDKRKNTYNVAPLLNLLGRFVEDVRAGKKVNIVQMFKDVVSGKSKAKKNEAPKPVPNEKPILFSDEVEAALTLVSEERQKVLRPIVNKQLKQLPEGVIIDKIQVINDKCTDDSKLYAYANTIFRNALNGNASKTYKNAPKKPEGGNVEFGITKAVEADREAHKTYEELSKKLQTEYVDVAAYFEQDTGVTLSTTSKNILDIEIQVEQWLKDKTSEHGSYEAVVEKSNAVFMDMLKGVIPNEQS